MLPLLNSGQLQCTPRIQRVKERVLAEPRYLSVEQALLVTESYKRTEGQPRCLRRAEAFAHVLQNLTLHIDPDELIAGNRSAQSRRMPRSKRR